MSEERGAPPSGSFADRMYPHLAGQDGALGEGGLDQARRMQQEGVAKPDPRFAAPPTRSEAREPAFDAARWRGAQLDLGEFSTVARDLNLSQRQAERLLEMHTKETAAQKAALERTWDSWHQTSRRDLGDRLEPMVSDIRQAIGTDHDAVRFYELLTWSGIEHDPATIRVLHKLATGRRY
jgi:hypothetical protein